MIIHITDDFDPDRIAQSGQCFRWEKMEGETWRIIAGGACLYLTPLGDDLYEFDCTEDEYENFWRQYFDLQENYQNIRARIDYKEDPFLWQAAEQEKGIRILRQDPWEMLITFIISQNRNIPAIRNSVELLAARCGDKRTDSRGEDFYAFPEPSALAALPESDLKSCKLGYRCKYVHAAAEAVSSGDIDLLSLLAADEASTINALTKLFGVGTKVANCVSLFGLHQMPSRSMSGSGASWMNNTLTAIPMRNMRLITGSTNSICLRTTGTNDKGTVLLTTFCSKSCQKNRPLDTFRKSGRAASVSP